MIRFWDSKLCGAPPLLSGVVRRQQLAQTMSDSFVAVVVTVPDDQFPDGDDICHTAGNYVCLKLESHLVKNGHSIPDWIQGGCEEDWGVYAESRIDETTIQYHICFSPSPQNAPQNQMLIQYQIKLPYMRRLFRKPSQLLSDHPMHETMRSFGNLFSTSRMLSQSQFESEY